MSVSGFLYNSIFHYFQQNADVSNPGILHYGKSNCFTSSARSVQLQPMTVEALTKNSSSKHDDKRSTKAQEQQRTGIYLSKTEIQLKKETKLPHNDLNAHSAGSGLKPADCVIMRNTAPSSADRKRSKCEEVPVGKFRAHPLSLKETATRNQALNGTDSKGHVKSEQWTGGSDEEDSCSTLSHRTVDSRHNTTDDGMSDDPEKNSRFANVQNVSDGYLSDAASEVSLRRYHQGADKPYTEDYFSDATTDSSEWSPRRPDEFPGRLMDDQIEAVSKSFEPELKPRRLSQQRTVLRASAESTGNAQRFKALAEKWEQRTDCISPPPSNPPPIPAKRDIRANSIASVILSSNGSSSKNG